jgi:putative oxidoreductase
MRDAALLGARLLLGSYMGFHASQKLFGKFHGPGLDGVGAVFEKNGLTPGREMAMAAAATEIAGGVLTITGVADPAGPLAVLGAMSVAAAHNRGGGLMAIRNGVELPVAYAALALALAAAGPGKYKLRAGLPGWLTAVGALAGGAAAGAHREDGHRPAGAGRARRDRGLSTMIPNESVMTTATSRNSR